MLGSTKGSKVTSAIGIVSITLTVKPFDSLYNIFISFYKDTY